MIAVPPSDGQKPRPAAGPARSTVRTSPRSLVRRRLFHAPGAVVGLTTVVLLVGSASLAPVLVPASPTQMNLFARLQPPSGAHFMGTDEFGRDILSRVLHAGRLSLLVGVVAVTLGGIIGVVLGALSGYHGGWPDHVIMRATDALHSFPAVLLAMAIMGALGTGLLNLMLAVGITSVPAFARITRSAVLAVRSLDYVLAARALGARSQPVLWRHVFPNSLAPVIVTATLQVASAVLAASSLSFLGMGIQPPTPEWGSMLAEGRGFMQRAPWLTAFPGLAIMLAVMGFNLLGDALRDAMDPALLGTRPQT